VNGRRMLGRLQAGIDTVMSWLPPSSDIAELVPISMRMGVAEEALEDLLAFAVRDAAAGGDIEYVYDSYACYQALLAYRVAHRVLSLPAPRRPLRTAARLLSEQAKVRTGVEIHPAATIGRRFVIDHGYGTVIGEQTSLGDDCYLLQGVTLGGLSIGYSNSCGTARRHPRIGSRVEIGGGASVFGPVEIGDDCRLDSGVRVTFDVPSGARVKLVAVTQVSLSGRHVEVHSISTVTDGLLVTGSGLTNLTPALLNEHRTVIAHLPVTQADDRFIKCGKPSVRPGRARLLGLFEEAILAHYVSGTTALREL